jgi:hypothetical protein
MIKVDSAVKELADLCNVLFVVSLHFNNILISVFAIFHSFSSTDSEV